MGQLAEWLGCFGRSPCLHFYAEIDMFSTSRKRHDVEQTMVMRTERLRMC
jgi:hypothetical protein